MLWPIPNIVEEKPPPETCGVMRSNEQFRRMGPLSASIERYAAPVLSLETALQFSIRGEHPRMTIAWADFRFDSRVFRSHVPESSVGLKSSAPSNVIETPSPGPSGAATQWEVIVACEAPEAARTRSRP